MASNTLAPMMYDGSTNPATFLDHFRLQSLFQDWDEAKQLTSLPLFLRGTAREMYTFIPIKTSIETVLTELIAACTQPQEVLLNQFFQRKQHPGESISKFAKALQELLHLADPTLPVRNQTTLLKAQLCQSLPEQMRAMINFNSTMSWNDLLRNLDKTLPHVVAYDQQQLQQPTRWDSQTQQLIPLDMIKTEPLNVNWLDSNANGTLPYSNNNNNNQHNSNRTQRSYNMQRFNGNCNYCQRFGHQEKDCRTKKKRDQQGASSNNNSYNTASSYSPNSPNRTNSYSNRRFGNTRGNNSHSSGNRPNNDQTINDNNHSTTRNVTTNALNIDDTQNSNEASNNEFPFFTESSTVQLSSLTQYIIPTPLLKLTVHLVLFNQQSQVVSALIDGGSSHSFISPTILTSTQLKIAGDKNNKLSDRHNFVITSATGN